MSADRPTAPVLGRYEVPEHRHVDQRPRTTYECQDCGALVYDRVLHDRSHAIGNHQARAIAVLLVSHGAASIHDKWNVAERVGRNDNNWSAEAFAEVVGNLSDSGDTTAWDE
jgi:hypothetical protein